MKSKYMDKSHLRYAVFGGILLLFAFYPAYFEYIPVISKGDILINLAILFGMALYYAGYRKIHTMLMPVIAFTLIQLASTLIHHRNVPYALWGRGILLVAMCGGVQWGYQKNERIFLKTSYALFYLLNVVNLCSLLFFPDGMFEDQRGIRDYNFFLGNYNAFIIYLFMALITGYLYQKRYKSRFSADYLLLWGISFFTFTRVRSVTSVAGLFMLSIYGLLFNYKWSRFFLNLKTYCFLNFTFFIMFVWNASDNIIVGKMVNLINKDITFTGRTVIWSGAKQYISRQWLIGNGLETQSVMTEKLGIAASHAHNLYLDILYKTGAAGFLIVCLCFFMMTSKLRKMRDEKVRYFLEAFLGIFMLMSQFEAYSIKFVFFMMMLIVLFASYEPGRKQGAGDLQ